MRAQRLQGRRSLQGAGQFARLAAGTVLAHEFAHSFVRPIIDCISMVVLAEFETEPVDTTQSH